MVRRERVMASVAPVSSVQVKGVVVSIVVKCSQGRRIKPEAQIMPATASMSAIACDRRERFGWVLISMRGRPINRPA
jgi:hypothetical protein